MTRVYAPDARNDRITVELTGDEAHHLGRVLRLGVGDEVAVFDGVGHEWAGRIATAGRTGMTVELIQSIDPTPEPGVRVTLAVGLLKGDQMDAVVRDATMLGVTGIVPLLTAHVSDSGLAKGGDKVLARWQRVAVASAKQCARAVVPVVGPIAPFDAVVRDTPRDQTIIATEPAAGGGRSPAGVGRPTSALVLVGPEGGWSRSELELALERGARPIQLGPRTLRAESAPIVLLSALWTEWGWI